MSVVQRVMYYNHFLSHSGHSTWCGETFCVFFLDKHLWRAAIYCRWKPITEYQVICVQIPSCVKLELAKNIQDYCVGNLSSNSTADDKKAMKCRVSWSSSHLTSSPASSFSVTLWSKLLIQLRWSSQASLGTSERGWNEKCRNETLLKLILSWILNLPTDSKPPVEIVSTDHSLGLK